MALRACCHRKRPGKVKVVRLVRLLLVAIIFGDCRVVLLLVGVWGGERDKPNLYFWETSEPSLSESLAGGSKPN